MRAFSKTTGYEVIGTVERMTGVAGISHGSFTRTSSGLDFDWSGTTDVDWDNQTTLRNEHGRVFVDDERNEVNETDIVLRRTDEEC